MLVREDRSMVSTETGGTYGRQGRRTGRIPQLASATTALALALKRQLPGERRERHAMPFSSNDFFIMWAVILLCATAAVAQDTRPTGSAPVMGQGMS